MDSGGGGETGTHVVIMYACVFVVVDIILVKMIVLE